jgi:hypothetical protein
MAVTIASGVEVRVGGGPSLKVSQSVPVEAYDLVDVTLAAGVTDAVVQVQPGGAGQVRFLMVSASALSPDLSYKVNDAGNPSHVLDRVLLLSGAGAVGLLGFAPESLLFTNATGSDVQVQILAGRDATP